MDQQGQGQFGTPNNIQGAGPGMMDANGGMMGPPGSMGPMMDMMGAPPPNMGGPGMRARLPSRGMSVDMGAMGGQGPRQFVPAMPYNAAQSGNVINPPGVGAGPQFQNPGMGVPNPGQQFQNDLGMGANQMGPQIQNNIGMGAPRAGLQFQADPRMGIHQADLQFQNDLGMGFQNVGPQFQYNVGVGGPGLVPLHDFRFQRPLPPNPQFHPAIHEFEDFDDFDDEYDPIPRRFPMMRRATIGHMPVMGPIVHPTGAIMDSYQFQRPYSYATGYIPGGSVYPQMGNDLNILRTILAGNVRTTDMRPFIDVLAARSPYEIEALRHNFRTITGGVDLGLAISTVLDATSQKQSVKYAFTGLVLGPALFDLWLLQQEISNDNEDILIDIFVGRQPEDIQFLNAKYQQQQGNMGQSLASVVSIVLSNNNISSPELQCALNICCEADRPLGHEGVDTAVVHRDVEEITRILAMQSPPHRELFNILLRRNDQHLAQVAMFYRTKAQMDLDEAIRRTQTMPSMTRKIATHAVRTATNLAHRDAMLLFKSMGSESIFRRGKDEMLALRVCRMHWYRHHWRNVRQVYLRLKGRQLVEKLSDKSGLLGDVLVAMTQVW